MSTLTMRLPEVKHARLKQHPSPRERGWLATGAVISRGESGEGSLPRLPDRRPDSSHHLAHGLVGVFHHHRIRNAH